MMLRTLLITLSSAALITGAGGCKPSAHGDPDGHEPAPKAAESHESHAGDEHEGADEHVHTDACTEDHTDHDHGPEVSLGTVRIGEWDVALAQGHGHVEAGKEAHLVVTLPESDRGATTVRAWLGSADRTLWLVGKGVCASAGQRYDVHVEAPDPLPAEVRWWIELEQPDGTTVTGSVKPRL